MLAETLPAEHTADSFGISTNTFFVVLINYPFLTAGQHQGHTALEVTSVFQTTEVISLDPHNLGLITTVKATHTSVVLH